MITGAQPRIERREYPERPVVGIAAIVVLQRNVLLVKRGKEPMRGAWSLPGGVLELGESIAMGVAREVREETGIDVRPVELIEVVDRILRDGDGKVQYHYVLIDWLCTSSAVGPDPLPSLTAGTDADASVWASLDTLDAFRLDETTTAVIRRAAVRSKELGLE